MDRRGFTLIELMTVTAIIGVLASIAMIKTSQSRVKATRASMISDLKNLVTAEEGYFSAFKDYAGQIAGAEVYGAGATGKAALGLSPGNVLRLRYRSSAGWSATITNPSVTIAPRTCGVFVGPNNYAPNAKVTQSGVPACY
jgi:prepilin-type N-terminal cleavage/methylation domain-containing protein